MIGFCQYLLSVEREKSVHIWEHYGISKSVQRKILYLGSWDLDAGFQLMDTPKWIRRGNLEVRDFKFILHQESNHLFCNHIFRPFLNPLSFVTPPWPLKGVT